MVKVAHRFHYYLCRSGSGGMEVNMDNPTERTGFDEVFLKNHDKSAKAYQNLLRSFSSELTLTASDYPDNYGGAYINRQGKLVIHVTKDVDTSKEGFEKSTQSSEIIIKTCKYSFKELTEIIDKLNSFKAKNPDTEIANNFNAYALLDAENRIVVELDVFSQEHIDKFKKEVSNASCIEFTQSSGELVNELTLNPGDGISASGGGGSVGYRARRSSNNGFVTAAHVATTTSTTSGANNVSVGSTVVARTTHRQESGSVDAAFCHLISPHTVSNSLGGGTLSTTIDTPAVGTIINKRGASTGTTSGSVLSTNASGTFDGIPFTNLTTADYTSAAGDSGGIVYTFYSGPPQVRNVCGIHKGAGGTTRYYCKAGLINTALSLTMH